MKWDGQECPSYVALGAGLPTPPLARPKVFCMRYAVAAFVSLLVLAGGAGWYRQLCESIKDDFRVRFQEAKDAGDLPPGMQDLDFETVWSRKGFGSEVSSSTMTKLELTSLLRGLWYVWVILICGVSFGIAHWMSPKLPQQESR
jgi:hypothetical protein